MQQARNNPTQEAGLQAADFLQALKNRWGIILLTFILALMMTGVIYSVAPPKYKSTAMVEIRPPGVAIAPTREQSASTNPSVSRLFFATQTQIIVSEQVLKRAAERLEYVDRWNMEMQDVINVLRSVISVQEVRGTELVAIDVLHKNADEAKQIAERVTEAYREVRENEERQRIVDALQELRDSVRDQGDIVEMKREALTRFVEENNIIYTPGSAVARKDQEVESYIMAQQSLQNREEEQLNVETQIAQLESMRDDQLLEYASQIDLPENVVKRLYPTLLEMRRNREAAIVNGLGARHPQILAIDKNIETIEGQLDDGVVSLRNTLRTNLAQLRARVSELGKMVAIKKQEAEAKGLIDQKYRKMNDDFERELERWERMRDAVFAEEQGLLQPRSPIMVRNEPNKPRDQHSPNWKLYLTLGAVLGISFGVGLAFLLESMDTSVKSVDDIEKFLGCPVLAVVPQGVGVLHQQGAASPDAEAYRILRTNIEFNRKNVDDNAITVVSGGAGEGKTTTLCNLAYICAQGGYTTLMIDADLRRPRLHTFFDINNSVGLTNFLITELDLEDVIVQTPVENLFFMPSGILPSDAAGILNSRRMSELIQDVKQRFDLVLIDSPPILGVSDASVLASEVDLTMIVVQHRKLPRNMLMKVKSAVENVGGRVVGVVLNNVDVRSDSEYQYYTSYYTYYSPTTHLEEQAPKPNTPSAKPQPRAVGGGDDSGDSDIY